MVFVQIPAKFKHSLEGKPGPKPWGQNHIGTETEHGRTSIIKGIGLFTVLALELCEDGRLSMHRETVNLAEQILLELPVWGVVKMIVSIG